MIGPSTPTIAALILLLASGTAMPQSATAPAPPDRPAPADGPVPIVVDGPASLDALWEKLRSPDYVLLRGDRYREMLKAGAPDSAKDGPIVEAVAVRGRIDHRTAELDVELRVSSPRPGSAWVPIRLDGLVLSSAQERDRIVPLRAGAGGGWEAEVTGPGGHTLHVALTTRVTANGEERRLDLPIPLAGATSLRLDLAGDPAEVSLGPGESILPVKAPGGGARVEAAMRPRSRIDLRWRIPTEQAGDVPPLLGVQGEVAADVTSEAVRTRSRWSVTSLRGATSTLRVTVDAADELIEVDLDGRSVPVDGVGRSGAGPLIIPLSEPLRPGGPARSLTLVSQRKLSEGTRARVPIRGPTIDGSSLQGGALAVTQNGPIWVEGDSARGLRRVDPANDLPSTLRSRPGTVLAYRIVARDFGLDLRVEASPPRVEAACDSLVLLKPGSATAETRLSFRTTPGRVFELAIPRDEGLEIEDPSPDESVESTHWTAGSGHGAGPAPRTLILQLTPKARESGSFALTLRTRQALPAGDRCEVRWPWPTGAIGQGGRVALARAPGVEATLARAPRPDTPPLFSRRETPRPEDWPWPLDRYASLDPAPLWLAFDGRPGILTLDVAERALSYRAETDIVARFGRSAVSYRESVRLEVVGGLLDDFEVIVPPDVGRDWTIEGLDVAARYLVGDEPGGGSRYRIVPARKGARAVTFDLRYETKFGPPLDSSQPRVGRFARIGLAAGAAGPIRLSCVPDLGVKVEVDRSGWQDEVGGVDPEGAGSLRLARREAPAELPEYRATAEPIATLPRLVVARAYLRTARGSDEQRTTARFRIESHVPSVEVELPPGARWVECLLDGEPVHQVETSAPGRYRVGLRPPAAKGARVLTIESSCSARGPAAWQPPTLVGASVRESYWTVVVPASQAVVGTPGGWSDENGWRWMGYVWMKVPSRTEDELSSWVAGGGPRDAGPGDDAPRSRAGQHAYLFRRPDGIGTLPAFVVPRSVVLVTCSGVVAAIGLGLVLIRSDRRPLAALAVALALMFAAAWEPDLCLQAVLSGALGVALTVVAAALQWAVNRRKSATTGRFASVAATAAPSSIGSPAGVAGSDESTAIRPRPAAGEEPFVLAAPAQPEAAPSLSEIGGRP